MLWSADLDAALLLGSSTAAAAWLGLKGVSGAAISVERFPDQTGLALCVIAGMMLATRLLPAILPS